MGIIIISQWYTLANAIKGGIVIPGSVGFLTAKNSLVWNESKPGRSPACIVIVKDEDDVAAAANFARHAGLQITVRGGGHSWSGLAVRRGGMSIDLSELRNFWIDKVTSTAVIQPSISNQQLVKKLQQALRRKMISAIVLGTMKPLLFSNHLLTFSPEKWQRLQVIRKKYDLNGLFFDYLEGL